MDRLAPTIRPDLPVVMRQNWHHLLFLHWEVPAEVLWPLLPPSLELDLFEGRAYVGLIPFTMTGIRPIGLPAYRRLSDLHETNVRTYVHVRGRDPGVWFFSLDAGNAAAVLLARAWFHLPYHCARMNISWRLPAQGDDPHIISYTSERRWPGPRPATCSIQDIPQGSAGSAIPGSLEHFLVERYFLYTNWRGRLYQGHVHHSPYPLQRAAAPLVIETMLAAAGIPSPENPPLAHYAEGVNVEVFPLQRIL